MRAPAGCIVHLAENVKRVVSIPVIAVNKLGDISFAEKVLQEGRADLIAMGRPLVMALENHGVRIMTKTRVDSITEQGILVERLGKKELHSIDGIVIAAGAEPLSEEVDDRIKQKMPEVHLIGDKVKARGILEAIREGHDVAERI